MISHLTIEMKDLIILSRRQILMFLQKGLVHNLDQEKTMNMMTGMKKGKKIEGGKGVHRRERGRERGGNV